MLRLLMCLLLAALLTSSTPVRGEGPTHTIPATAYCLSEDSAEKIAREDAKNGLEAASAMFAEADDCQMGSGQLILVGVISTHKVKRPGGEKVLYVYEAKNPMITFYLVTTAKLLKEDTGA